VSGFTVLGLALVALALSLRKRWRRFSSGTVARWRLVHGAVAVAALVVLTIHTELRLGANANLALMVSFLGTALTGAVAAVVVGTLKPTKARSLAIRSFFVGAHIVLFWALPALVALHVATVYYFSAR
jgi:nitrite reductase (NADH) large subunit